VSSGIDWEGFASTIPVLLWLVFLLLKKKKQSQKVQDKEPGEAKAPRKRRRDETPQFERDYDPIEPS